MLIRKEIFKSYICSSTFKKAINFINNNNKGYVCFSNVHTIIEGNRNPELLEATNNSLISFPDGMPLVFYHKLFNKLDTERISGIDVFKQFMLTLNDKKHLLLGGSIENNRLILF